LWLDLAVLLEGLLLGLGVRGVTIKPSEYVPVAGSVSKSEWEFINRSGSKKKKPKKSPGKNAVLDLPKPGRKKK